MSGYDDDFGRLPRIRLDLTPLVDVIFLLLIFFMVSTTFRDDQGIPLELPEASSATAADESELRVRLGEDGSIYFQDRRIEIDALEAAAREALGGDDQRFFMVEADARAAHGQVVKVMDSLRRAGAHGLTVATAAAGGGG